VKAKWPPWVEPSRSASEIRMAALGTKPRCESATERSGVEDKADVQARTHHLFVRVG
jgi:hypothetical protein